MDDLSPIYKETLALARRDLAEGIGKLSHIEHDAEKLRDERKKLARLILYLLQHLPDEKLSADEEVAIRESALEVSQRGRLRKNQVAY